MTEEYDISASNLKPPTSKSVIIVVGPTAVGKTALAIELARWLGTEIISADSRQCFRELNIGVARPSEEELAAVRHHFIASHSILDEVNAAVFEAYALQTVKAIFRQHDNAVMVGGTGLYVKAFCEGMDEIPAVKPGIRAEIIAGYETHGLTWLQEQVLAHDPIFYASGEVQNPQRLMRALEVVLSTGRSIRTYQSGQKQPRPFAVHKIGLDLPRAELYDRINRRVDLMMESGLLQEVSDIFQHMSYTIRNGTRPNALQTVGYSELLDFLEGKCSLGEAVDKIKINTRHYAKRQLTWFRRDPSITWYHPADTAAIKKWLVTRLTCV
ncbi:tRNA (adenosine(37)-N6)-dimethylallyltransferase MiaA [Flavihumibacter stibioxidans]|uniref:tRNA dimethylallyltransferase n=1 Tax=Flavihumibacter stibioxidans TaxID=1834163 RepID=A0ABR7MC01_9BACT|nr:tRNA (adenosine(37)-N6)-dimethylallyltransferase MiaA [Flavihumibacter stibioxidans]MBC6492265.1 tRNA (adenosine(37)-N6)-dimethylallyltransferase MiaA [Flavihumibacter stibioxidans]